MFCAPGANVQRYRHELANAGDEEKRQARDAVLADLKLALTARSVAPVNGVYEPRVGAARSSKPGTVKRLPGPRAKRADDNSCYSERHVRQCWQHPTRLP
jgi:hypothetical protein